MSLADVCADEAAVHREVRREKGMVREGRVHVNVKRGDTGWAEGTMLLVTCDVEGAHGPVEQSQYWYPVGVNLQFCQQRKHWRLSTDGVTVCNLTTLRDGSDGASRSRTQAPAWLPSTQKAEAVASWNPGGLHSETLSPERQEQRGKKA